MLAGALALGAFPTSRLQDGAATTARLLPNERGGYRYVPGIAFFSFGALAAEGFEIVRATFRRPRPFPEGFPDVEAYLRAEGRPIHALCGFEFRSGRQATMPEFIAFNTAYVETLRKAGVLVDGQMPVTRTSVALPGTQPSHRIHAFTYTVPVRRPSGPAPTFVLTGIPDVRNLGPAAETIAKGDVSAEGLRQKTVFILDTIEALLKTMAVSWRTVTNVQLYTIHDIHPLLASLVLPRIGDAARLGIQWHLTQLPVVGGDVEIDVRSIRMELMLDG
jgi:hypothetical protein